MFYCFCFLEFRKILNAYYMHEQRVLEVWLTVKKLQVAEKPNLSFIMLISFLASFAAARGFTSLFPSTIFVFQGYRVHHFWYGLSVFGFPASE